MLETSHFGYNDELQHILLLYNKLNWLKHDFIFWEKKKNIKTRKNSEASFKKRAFDKFLLPLLKALVKIRCLLTTYT